MSSAGKIVIDMDCADNALQNVRISSSRPTNLARILNGQPPQAAAALLPKIFGVCANAHGFAAATACGPSDSDRGTTQLVVLCENAREHLLRIFLGWHRDEADSYAQHPLRDAVGLVAEMQKAGTNPNMILAVASDLRRMLKASLFGIDTSQWQAITTTDALADWAARHKTVAARFVHRIYHHNWQSVGATTTRCLPQTALLALSDRLHSDDADSFVAQPDWDGIPRETGPLARFRDHPLIVDLDHHYGIGLLARHVARLVELASIPDDIENLVTSVCQPVQKDHLPGIAKVQTARGWLVHSVKLTDETIADYRILAPTEWNFNSDGVVRDSLQAVRATTRDELAVLAELVIKAFDPCVEYEIRVH